MSYKISKLNIQLRQNSLMHVNSKRNSPLLYDEITIRKGAFRIRRAKKSHLTLENYEEFSDNVPAVKKKSIWRFLITLGFLLERLSMDRSLILYFFLQKFTESLQWNLSQRESCKWKYPFKKSWPIGQIIYFSYNHLVPAFPHESYHLWLFNFSNLSSFLSWQKSV